MTVYSNNLTFKQSVNNVYYYIVSNLQPLVKTVKYFSFTQSFSERYCAANAIKTRLTKTKLIFCRIRDAKKKVFYFPNLTFLSATLYY